MHKVIPWDWGREKYKYKTKEIKGRGDLPVVKSNGPLLDIIIVTPRLVLAEHPLLEPFISLNWVRSLLYLLFCLSLWLLLLSIPVPVFKRIFLKNSIWIDTVSSLALGVTYSRSCVRVKGGGSIAWAKLPSLFHFLLACLCKLLWVESFPQKGVLKC